MVNKAIPQLLATIIMAGDLPHFVLFSGFTALFSGFFASCPEMQVHKSYILSVGSITAVRKNSVFIGDLELSVGETYRGALRQLTEKNL